jgi:hypothetical protein
MAANPAGSNAIVHIDASKVVHEMKGGIGASWHALSREVPLENEKYDYPVRFGPAPRGSAYGGNPPVADTAGWEQLALHARWLGLNFIRVELSQHMYEPERNRFDWDNEEMLALYRILDCCELMHADVFLQQMWGHVAWNAFPGVHPLLSAPRSLPDFADGIAALLDHLTRTKGYRCIRYFCITNEPPGGTWGYWWCYGSGSGSVTPAWKIVRETLDARGITIPLSGPDWTSLPPFDSGKIDFDEYIGAYDIHSYGGIDDPGVTILADWVRWAAEHRKPFFLSEFGNMNLGWGESNPGPKSFAAALSNASDVIRGINVGVDAFNRWSFTNRGDIDGQWQLVETWDREKKCHSRRIFPERAAYFGFAMLTRFIGKYPSVLNVEKEGTGEGVEAAALRNRDGNLTILLLNRRKDATHMRFGIAGIGGPVALNLYQVTEPLVTSPEFNLNPAGILSGFPGVQEITVPPESISVLTTYRLRHDEPGIVE